MRASFTNVAFPVVLMLLLECHPRLDGAKVTIDLRLAQQNGKAMVVATGDLASLRVSPWGNSGVEILDPHGVLILRADVVAGNPNRMRLVKGDGGNRFRIRESDGIR